MVGMRNIAAHEYFRLDTSILWETATRRIPPLVPVIEDIIEPKTDSSSTPE
jgi:uncharacterized protein with HEPN domain